MTPSIRAAWLRFALRKTSRFDAKTVSSFGAISRAAMTALGTKGGERNLIWAFCVALSSPPAPFPARSTWWRYQGAPNRPWTLAR